MNLDLNMNPNILVSLVNMKLRNDFSDLDDLCSFYDVRKEDLEKALMKEDYFYCSDKNQFLIK